MKDAKGHGSDPRGAHAGGVEQVGKPRPMFKPIPDSPFHQKTDAELHFIARDASAAGANAQGMGDAKGVSKYADQVNDAATVLGYRQRGGTQDNGGANVVIHHHPDYDEYRVPNPGEPGKGAGYFTNDKQDAIDTAKAIHGANANISFRSKRYETV